MLTVPLLSQSVRVGAPSKLNGHAMTTMRLPTVGVVPNAAYVIDVAFVVRNCPDDCTRAMAALVAWAVNAVAAAGFSCRRRSR